MSSIAEFIEARESIEKLAAQITIFVERKAVLDSRKHLDEANRQLQLLKTMVANDTQVIVDTRLSRQLAGLGVNVEKMEAKMPVRPTAAKKQPQKAAEVPSGAPGDAPA